MTISELIKILEHLKKEVGDGQVVCQTLSHYWAPDPRPRLETNGKLRFVLLNP